MMGTKTAEYFTADQPDFSQELLRVLVPDKGMLATSVHWPGTAFQEGDLASSCTMTKVKSTEVTGEADGAWSRWALRVVIFGDRVSRGNTGLKE